MAIDLLENSKASVFPKDYASQASQVKKEPINKKSEDAPKTSRLQEMDLPVGSLSKPETIAGDKASRNVSDGFDMRRTKAGETVSAEKQKDNQKYNEVMAEKAVKNANSRVRASKTTAKFAYNEDINRITITLMDENKELVKEIPSKDTQKMLENIHMLRGLMVDKEI